jgi:LuxR family maltose regulon positive regulatory protein
MLFTKIHIPGITQNFVLRKHINDKLNEVCNKKVILISAPAGYGKTSVLVDWINRNKIPTAWYSLDENDNNLNIFLNYVVAGFQTIDNSIGVEIQQSLKSNAEIPVETIIDILVSNILESGKEIQLVLDDFHLIKNDKIVQFVRYFIDYKPENLILSFITRSDPSIQVSKLRSKQKLIEIRLEDLRFSAVAISEFFQKTHHIKLNEADICTLLTKTEGWISGLHLAGISIQSQESISSFIENFKGNNRYIMDYLMDEVLSSMNDTMKQFLLKTSILDRMCTPLCDHLLQSTNSIEQLTALEKNNLFIIPLDDEREWYRYHHLFSDLLKKRLKQSSLINIPELHTLASEWLINNNLVDEAIRHLLLANNYHRAAELISREMFKIWDDGNHYKFNAWLELLPENMVSQTPQLCILKAELAMARWQIQDAENLLNNARKLLHAIERDELKPLIPLLTTIKNYNGRILVNYALIASYHENPKDILRNVDEALEKLSEDQLIWRNLALMIQSDAYFILGKLNDANRGQVETNKSYQIAQNPFLYLMSGANLVVTIRQLGKLHEVIKLCEKFYNYGIEKGLKNTTVLGWLLAIKGEVLAELNNLEEAEKMALKGLETVKRFKIVGICLKCYLLLIRVYFSAKKYAEIDKILLKMTDESMGFGTTIHIKNQIDAWKARIFISQKQFDEVDKWLFDYEKQEDISFDYINENKHIAASRAYVALGKFEESRQLLKQIKVNAENYDRTHTLIEILLIQTQINYQLEQHDFAKECFSKALSLAEPGGYIRIFVDEGAIIEELIKNLQKTKKYSDPNFNLSDSDEYLNKIARAFQLDYKKKEQTDTDLSSRELEILQLISQKMSNKEICETLFISLPTVKTHISNILLKLEAKNRIEAAEIAKEKGIV